MRLHQLTEDGKEVVNEKNDSFRINIEDETTKNTNYRTVLHTTKLSQVVVMSIKPGDEIGMEVHKQGDQFIRIESGVGESVLDGKKEALNAGVAVVVAAGSQHNIVNTSKTEDLKLYAIYTPPEHKDGTIDKDKPE